MASRALALVAIAACGTTPIRHAPVDLSRADTDVERGCYDCLIEARQLYRGAGAARQTFEVDLLLALRDKELGLSPADALDDARRIAAGFPASVEASRYLALVDAVPNDAMSSPKKVGAFIDAHMTPAMHLDAERAWLASSPMRANVRDYLALALDCTYGPAETAPPIRASSPVLAFRKEICGLGRVSALTAMRAGEPRFVETSYFTALTEIAMAAWAGPANAKAHLDEARARFPDSLAIALALGMYHRIVGDYTAALATYDELLAKAATNPDALLGRTICLGALERRVEAIAAATRLIDLGDHLAEAYAERARHRHALGKLANARTDIDAAKAESGSPGTLSLAGVIEYDQGDFETARADLDIAAAADEQDCTARWYLGLVGLKRETPASAAKAFAAATECYRSRAKLTAERIRQLSARADLDVTYRARQIASLEASVTADEQQATAAERFTAKLAGQLGR